jgi:hypothetical protein
MRLKLGRPMLAAAAIVALAPTVAQANFHLWQVKEVFSNHDGSVQFIELFNSFSNEQFISGHAVRANSDGAIKNYPFTGNLTVPAGGTTAGKHMLLATPGFAALAGGVTPNFTLPDPAVNGPFFDPNATSITITFDGSSDSFAFAGATLPTDGINSLTDANAFGSPNNPTNIGATMNSPTNFAGAVGSVDVPPPPVTTGDYNLDTVVNAADYTVWRDSLGQNVDPGTGADGEPDGTIDVADYTFWKQRFGTVVSGSAAATLVPEPSVFSLAFCGFLGIIAVAARTRFGGGKL